MTKQKSTKKTLLTSVLSLVLCMAMLVGTTFAWFTDNVTSKNNIIKSGNLDVEMYYQNDTVKEWTKVTSETNIFKNDTLWEPGHTEVVKLKVVNEGTLALKYQLGINVESETGSVNKDGEPFKLSDYIYFGLADGEQNYTRETAIEAVEKDAVAIASGITRGNALAVKGTGTSEECITMVVYMPETVGNEANYGKGQATPTINLGLNLFATQNTVEADSFGTDYDKDTAVFTVAEANAMLADNKDVALVNCNEPNGVLYVPENYEGTLVLHNVTIASVQQTASVSTLALTETNTVETKANKIVILGNVVVKATEEGMSAITGTALDISGNGTLTAVGKGKAAFGIGGMDTEKISVKGITIAYVEGGCAYGVGSDTKYYKDAPEGGAAIGSGHDGAVITLNGVTVNKAIGGSKAAGIGARYHVGVTVNIKNSTIAYVEGGVSAAGIGGSRVSGDATESGNIINISGSTITAKGGVYGAGIGSGYDTHCLSKQPMCEINIDASTINATGGQYAAGVGTGYHNAALKGEIANSTVKATSGDKYYKDTYTSAMDIGFGVVDPAREGAQTDSYIEYNGSKLTMNDAFNAVSKATDLDMALSNGEDVVLGTDLTFSSQDTTANSGYGATGVSVKGGTFDGNGKTLTVTNANGTWDSAVHTTGGTIKNLTVSGAMRGIFMGSATKDLYIDNVVFDDVVYTFNSDGGSKEYGVYISNSTLNGWTSWSNVHKEIEFTNCKFGEGCGYAFMNAYQSVTFKDCDFAEGFEVNPANTSTYLTFENCTYNGVLITKDNVADVLYAASDAYLCIVNND